ncbi:MAG: hypothetical protein ACXV7C_16005, partial [Candidatus Angelobacter sp.]
QDAIQAFLNSLVLFPPDDTASTLDPGVRTTTNFNAGPGRSHDNELPAVRSRQYQADSTV